MAAGTDAHSWFVQTDPDERNPAAVSIPVERVFTLLDAVVAIAMTILVLDIRLPPGLSGAPLRTALAQLGTQISYFVLSVVVIGLFWQGHHQVLRRTAYITAPLLWLNFAFLALLALIPFPTNALEDYSGTAVGTALYGATIGLTALVELLMWLHITRPGGPGRSPVHPVRWRATTVSLSSMAVIFGLSVPVAFIAPGVAEYVWLAVLPIRLACIRAARRAQVD